MTEDDFKLEKQQERDYIKIYYNIEYHGREFNINDLSNLDEVLQKDWLRILFKHLGFSGGLKIFAADKIIVLINIDEGV